MPRDARALLWDTVQACDAVAGFVTGRDLEGYRGDLLLRSAVERQLAVAGEAMSQLARTEPDLAGQVGEWRSVVAFRNILVHQ